MNMASAPSASSGDQHLPEGLRHPGHDQPLRLVGHAVCPIEPPSAVLAWRRVLRWLATAVLGAALGLAAGAPASAQRLIEFTRAALDTNPYLRMRQLEWERARAEADGVASRLQPQVVAQGGWSRNDYRGAAGDERRYDGRRAGLTARLALLDLPSRRRLDAARQSAGQRENDAAQTRMALLSQVVGTYLDLLQADAEIGALDGERAAVQRQVGRLRAMRARQMAKVTDLAETEAWARTLDTRRIDLQQQREQTSARLTELTGLPVGMVTPLQALTVEPTTQDMGDANASAPAPRADAEHPRLAALAHAAEAARQAVAGARAEHLPQLALVGSHTYTDLGYDNRE
jgi:outer membrane protein TolC